MKPRVVLRIAVLCAMFVPAAVAQDPGEGSSSSDLIAWTEMQRPEPTQKPQPVPLPDQQPEGRPDTQQPPSGQTSPPNSEMDKQPATETFVGKILKAADRYVLKTSDNSTYQLDDQDRASKFEGKQVQVMGSLDPHRNLIHVQDIKAGA